MSATREVLLWEKNVRIARERAATIGSTGYGGVSEPGVAEQAITGQKSVLKN
jgi:hypothetical protein